MKSHRRLALVWGRKFFFSYGLLILASLGLLFFQHMAKPESTLAWLYLVTTYIGHFGVMITLGYFGIYVPLVWISSGYYWSRFWASAIMTALVGLVAFDVMIVGQYRWHFYELIRFKNNLSIDDLLEASGASSVFLGALIVFWVLMFVIGEKLWRHLQRRFSQTVSNWYLYPIIGCFLISNTIHVVADYKKNQEILTYAGILSFQPAFTAKKIFNHLGFEPQGQPSSTFQNQSVFYPKDQLKCENKSPKNLVIILVPSWSQSNFLNTESEIFRHYASHGQRFDQNYIGTNNEQEGIFSFFYGLPAFYMKSFLEEKNEAVFFEALKSLSVQTSILSSLGSANFLQGQVAYEAFADNMSLVEAFKMKLAQTDEMTPFAYTTILQHQSEAELVGAMKGIIEELVLKKKMKTTNIIVASISSNEPNAPLFTLFPNREDKVVTHFTQLVDVIPSLMKEQYKCKNNFTDYSLGQNLWEIQKKNILFSGMKENLSILSFDAEKKMLIQLEKQDYLKELKALTLFYKRTR